MSAKKHSPTTKLAVIFAAAALTIALNIMGVHLLKLAYPESTLPEPGPHPILPAQSVHTFMDVAAANGGVPHMTREVHVKHRDRERFDQHFRNIAARRGWYAFPDAYRTTLIIPASDIHELDSALQDPMTWTTDQLRIPSNPPRPPEGQPAPESPHHPRIRLQSTGSNYSS